MSLFTGAGVAIITPMKQNLEIDFERFEALVEFQIQNHTDAIIVCGTTGEASTLSHEEHLSMIKTCVEYVHKRVPVIAGTGSNSTETAIYLSGEAQKLGADGLLLVSPYYNKATQNGLYQHFRMIAEAVSIPILLYNIQGRTGVNITPETIVRLCQDVPNIIGVKEASDNINQIAKLAALSEGKVDIYSGNDNQILPIMSLGGLGVISVLSNIAPKQVHDLCQKFLDGDIAGSRKMQLDAMDLIDKLFCEVNPIPVKKAMEILGLCEGNLRMPLTPMEAATTEKLLFAMRSYGLLQG
ncbi:MAG: 4-hydroxy-tetrahydrodipicolinate synthase [Clostridium sp.]|nr:4-hydroxy-tetrahydrodipicolinate synthase [Clostridium sp.]